MLRIRGSKSRSTLALALGGLILFSLNACRPMAESNANSNANANTNANARSTASNINSNSESDSRGPSIVTFKSGVLVFANLSV